MNFEKLKSTGADGIILSSFGANNAELNEVIHVGAVSVGAIDTKGASDSIPEFSDVLAFM